MANETYEGIVATVGRPTLVMAGPGAGKTYLLGDKVKRLLDAKVGKEHITILTFGREASQHMRNKLLDTKEGFGVPYTDLPNISTMHALGLEIVNRKSGAVGLRKTNLLVQDEEKVKRLLYRDAALIVGLSESDANAALECKQLGDCERGSKDSMCSVCEKYWDIMSKCNRIDFDDQVLFACRILEGNSDLLNEFQDRSQHLLVDEYQDINAAQFRLINLLSKKSRGGLFAVGDDAQSIYKFRGADPGFILRFKQDFPGASTPPLGHSRRFHQLTMRDAEKVLNKYYPEWKGPYELEYHVKPGDEPSIWQVPHDRAEAKKVAVIARQAIGDKKNVLVLAPKKEFFPRISQTLRDYGVPHECPANLLPDAANRRLQAIFPLLQWVKEPANSFRTRLAIETLLDHGSTRVPGARKGRTPKPETIAKRVSVETEIAGLWEDVDRKRDFVTVLRGFPGPSDHVKRIRDTLNDLDEAYRSSRDTLHGEFAKRLARASGAWIEPAKMVDDLSSIMDLLTISQPNGFGSVQVMTMRKAKGLEADVVIMVGLEDDIMPSPTAGCEEEARLFYVSMTRAKEELHLIHSYTRLRSISYGEALTGKRRSRFLDAIGRKSKYVKM